MWSVDCGRRVTYIEKRLLAGYQSTRHTVNSSQVNSSHARFFHTVNSSHGQLVTQSTRHAMGSGVDLGGQGDRYVRLRPFCMNAMVNYLSTRAR